VTHWTDDERITEVLREARLMFLAVSGPHVAPLAFDHRGEDLWAITPRRSAKVRAIRRDPRVGMLVRHGEDAVMPADGPTSLIPSPAAARSCCARTARSPGRLPHPQRNVGCSVRSAITRARASRWVGSPCALRSTAGP